jgi:hypothetical protein
MTQSKDELFSTAAVPAAKKFTINWTAAVHKANNYFLADETNLCILCKILKSF